MIKFVIWDVQHGNSTYLKTPVKNIVFDLGTGSYGNNQEFSPLLHLKNVYKVQQLDGVIITHPHTDHIADILNFYNLSPRYLWRPSHLTEEDIRKANPSKDKPFIDEYLAINKHYSYPIPDKSNPLLPMNNGGVDIKMFSPRKCATSNINNHSIVSVISYASSKMLIPGDNQAASWNELLENDAFIRAISGTDILLAPHHGRASGFSNSLFEHISPKLVIISDGKYRDTSVTDRYSKKASGWTVCKRNGGSEERKCITTRSDGVIVVKFGYDSKRKPVIEITTN